MSDVWWQFFASVMATLAAAALIAFVTWLVKSYKQFLHMVEEQKITNTLLGRALQRIDSLDARVDALEREK